MNLLDINLVDARANTFNIHTDRGLEKASMLKQLGVKRRCACIAALDSGSSPMRQNWVERK